MVARRWIPNLLTGARMVAVPGCLVLMLVDFPHRDACLLALFLAAAGTDFLDGYLARQWRVTSALGALLDPIADKLIVVLMLIYLLVKGQFASAPDQITAADNHYPFLAYLFLPVVAMVLRELYISGLREFLAARGVALPVSKGGKLKTVLQMTGIGLLLAAPVLSMADLLTFGCMAIWLAAIVSLISAVQYTRAGWPAISR